MDSFLFSTDMVKRILDGGKWQTRRVIPEKMQLCRSPEDEPEFFVENCRYGQPGDHRRVRESWRIVGWNEDGDWQIEYRDGTTRWFDSVQEIDEETSVRYWEQCTEDCDKAGIPTDENGDYMFDSRPCPTRWRPSIFLPRWASRIMLEITKVRVEKVQDISYEDALAEGIVQSDEGFFLAPLAGVPDFPWNNPLPAFASLWNSKNLKRGYGWDVNPWVWAIDFRMVQS